MVDDDVELSVVLPCLDEADTLATCVTKALTALAVLGVRGEVVVADNGSKDGSREIAVRAGARVVPVPERGYGAALLGGIAASRGRFVLMADADDSYDLSQLGPFLEKLREGAELVMGCRLRAGGGTIAEGAMPVTHRLIGNPALTFLARRMFGLPVHDVYCGMRAFTRELFDRLDLRCTGMEFATEMVVKASLFSARIAEVPITLHRDGRVAHPPHLNTISDGLRTLRFFLLYSPRWLFLVPGAVLGGAGILSFALLLPGPFPLPGGAVLDAHTLLVGALACLVAHQLVVFAVFTKLFAISEGLLPPDARMKRVDAALRTGAGVWLGAIATAAGLGLLAVASARWAARDFGEMDYPTTLRWVISGVTTAALGVQTLFASLFVGILGLKRRG